MSDRRTQLLAANIWSLIRTKVIRNSDPDAVMDPDIRTDYGGPGWLQNVSDVPCCWLTVYSVLSVVLLMPSTASSLGGLKEPPLLWRRVQTNECGNERAMFT